MAALVLEHVPLSTLIRAYPDVRKEFFSRFSSSIQKRQRGDRVGCWERSQGVGVIVMLPVASSTPVWQRE